MLAIKIISASNLGVLLPSKNDFSNSGKPFITATQISELGELSFEKCQKLPEKFYKKLRIGFSQKNDVLFTHNATVGRVSIMPPNAPDSILGTSVTYYRLDEVKINKNFFSHILKSNFVKKQYQREMFQTTRQQFSILKQAKLKIPMPKIEEQVIIGNILNEITLQVIKQTQFLEKLQLFKIILLQNIFSNEKSAT